MADVLDIVRGLDPSDPNDDLINVSSFVPKMQRFTAFYDIDSDRQVDPPLELTSIDHVLVSPGLAARIKTVQIDHDLNPVPTSGFPCKPCRKCR